MTDEFKFEKQKKKEVFFTDGIFFGEKRGTVSKKTMTELNLDKWRRMDVYFDFKKMAFAIEQNDAEGILGLDSMRRAFSTLAFSDKAKRGRYKFHKKDGSLYIFIYDKEANEK